MVENWKHLKNFHGHIFSESTINREISPQKGKKHLYKVIYEIITPKSIQCLITAYWIGYRVSD